MSKSSKKQGFMHGIVILIISQIIIKVLGLVYKLYLTNKQGFGDAGNAIYSSGFQIYALLLTLSSIGVPNAVSKLISSKMAIGDSKGAHRVFKIAFMCFSIIGFCCTAILYFGADYISNTVLKIPEAELTLIALSPSIFFVSVSSVIRGYFNGRENMKATANSQSIEQIFKTLLTIIIVEFIGSKSNLNTTIMAAGANLATTIAAFSSFIYLYKYYLYSKKDIWQDVNSSVKYKRERICSILKNIFYVSIPISLGALMAVLTKNIDAVTVVRGLSTFMSEDIAKIQYGILSGKVDTLLMLPLSFNVAFAIALVPAISSAYAIGKKEIANKRVGFCLLVTILIGLPCTVGLIIFANPILSLLFPNATDGALILQISAISIIFSLMTQTIDGALQGIGKTFIPVFSLCVGAIIKLILNLILIPIPNIGITGAAVGSVVCHITTFIISFYLLKKYMNLELRIIKYCIKPILAVIIMAFSSSFIFSKLTLIISQNMATIIVLFFAVIIYIISLFILKIFSKDEIYMIPYGKKISNLLEKIRK